MIDPHPRLLRRSSPFGPYSKYKDSGVEWLGQIPAHWTVGRVKDCAAVWLSNVDKKVVQGEPQVRLCNYTDVYYQERIDSGLDFMQATAKPEQVRRFSLRRGDVLITKDSETWTDIAVPAVVVEDLPGVLCGYHLALIRPKSHCLGAFLGAAIGAVGLRDQYRISANGVTRFGLTGDAIRNGVLPLPPLEEQRAITSFLARETARIEELVAKQKRLIDLLQEKRVALLTRAVTRGLDANAAMKNSGVEWLDEIPAHWTVARVKECATVRLSNVDKKVVDGEPQVRLCNYTDVYYQERIDSQLDFMSATATPQQVRRFSLRRGDVLITKDSETWTDIAVPALAAEDMRDVLCGYHLALLRPKSLCLGAYLGAAIAAAGLRDQYRVSANGVTRFGLTGDAIKNGVLPLPPREEQCAITAFVDRETARIEEVIAAVNESIDRLVENRSALIAAAVTGKINVRRHSDARVATASEGWE